MICVKCEQERGNVFHPRYRQCKACHEEGQRDRDKRNPLTRYWIRIKSLYGLSKDGFMALLDLQEKRCAVCRCDIVKPDVDHCHECRSVRGLLCHRCNVLCGHLENNRSILEAALGYLGKHQH